MSTPLRDHIRQHVQALDLTINLCPAYVQSWQPVRSRCFLSVVVLLNSAIVSTAVSVCNATDSPAQRLPTNDFAGGDNICVLGRVLNSHGMPISDAHVIYTLLINGKETPFSTKTSDQGSFTLRVPAKRDPGMPVLAWAYATGHAVGTVSLSIAVDESPEIRNVDIELPPAETVHYQVLRPSGKPCVGAVVAPYTMIVLDDALDSESTGVRHIVPAELAELTGRKTDETGSVVFDAVTTSQLDSLVVTHEDFGEQVIEQHQGELRLVTVGSVDGVVAGASRGELAGTAVWLITDTDTQQQGIATAKIDESGRFSVPAIAAGRLRIQLMVPNHDAESLPYLEQTLLEVRAKETLAVEMELRPTVLVKGTLRDTKTGPLANTFLTLRNPHCPVPQLHCVTDAKGQFQLRLLPGNYSIPLLTPSNADGYSTAFRSPLTLTVPSDAEEVEVDFEITQ